MDVFFTENLRYSTQFDQAELLERLNELIEPKQFIRFDLLLNKPSKPYEGVINGNIFKMNRIRSNRRTFLLRIKGVIAADTYGSIVHVKMRLHPAAYFALFVLATGPFGIAIGEAAQASTFAQWLVYLLMLLLLVSVPYWLLHIGYQYEIDRVMEDLRELFDAEGEEVTHENT